MGADEVLFGSGDLTVLKWQVGRRYGRAIYDSWTVAFMRSPEPASNNVTLAVVGVALKSGGIRRFVRENYYPRSALSALSCAEERQTLLSDEPWIKKD